MNILLSEMLSNADPSNLDVARLCAENVVVPEGVGCCGFAGDKGMTNPELNRYALRKLHDQVKDIEVGYSNSRTCEKHPRK